MDFVYKIRTRKAKNFAKDIAGNLEDELDVILYSSKDNSAHEMRSYARYPSLEIATKADAEGSIKCLGNALKILGI